MRLGATVAVCLAGAASAEDFTWVIRLAEGQSGACKDDGPCHEEGSTLVELSSWIPMCSMASDPNCHYDIIFDIVGFKGIELDDYCNESAVHLNSVAEITLPNVGDLKGEVTIIVNITAAKNDCQADHYLQANDIQCVEPDMGGKTHIVSSVKKGSEGFVVVMDFDTLSDLDSPSMFTQLQASCGSTVSSYEVKSVQFTAGFKGLNPSAAGAGGNAAIGLFAVVAAGMILTH